MQHLFNFTQVQIDLLAHLARVEAGKKLELVFNNPAEDQQNMRRAIYLDGGLQMLQYLVDFDDRINKEKEEQKQQLAHESAAATTAVPQSTNLDF